MIDFPTRERFEQWLLRLPQDKVIATDWQATTCPLCVFLESEGCEAPFMGGHGFWAESGFAKDKPQPSWAREFVYWVDRVKPREVTAEDCLFILNQPAFRSDRWGTI